MRYLLLANSPTRRDDRKHFTGWWSEVLNKLGTNVTADDLVQSTKIDQDLFSEMCKPSDDVYYQSIKLGFDKLGFRL